MTVPNFNKGIADGKCGACGEPVPASNLNKFYCSGSCTSQAFNYHHEYCYDCDDHFKRGTHDNCPNRY